jgi:hypothetical protein
MKLHYGGIINGDWFVLIKARKMKKLYTLDELLEKFNPEDYWIYKASNKQKLVTTEEMKEFENAGYIFFHKSKYNPDYINHWITHINRLMHTYMAKPTPPDRKSVV